MKRRLAGAAITMLVAGVAAGCGGDDTDAPAKRDALTKAEFVERADALCAAADRRIEAEAAKLRSSAKKTGTLPSRTVVRFLEQSSIPAYERMLLGLRDLTPPKSDEQRVDGFVASVAGAIDAVKQNPQKYARRTTADPFDDANKRARAYGLKVCGS